MMALALSRRRRRLVSLPRVTTTLTAAIVDGGSRLFECRPSSSPSSTLSSASLNPLRGSLNSRRRRQRLPVVAASSSTSSSSSSSSNDDFALRASMHSDDLDYSSSSSSSPSSPSRDQQEDTSADNEQQLYERRAFIQGMLTAATSAAVGFTSISADPRTSPTARGGYSWGRSTASPRASTGGTSASA